LILKVMRGAAMVENNKHVVQRFVEELWNQAKLDVANELVHPEYGNEEGYGPDAVKANVRALRLTAFPDLHFEIEHLIAEADYVVAHMTATGTHLGTFRDVYPATGRRVTWQEIGIWRVEDGKLREGWFAAHELDLRRQLGLIPDAVP